MPLEIILVLIMEGRLLGQCDNHSFREMFKKAGAKWAGDGEKRGCLEWDRCAVNLSLLLAVGVTLDKSLVLAESPNFACKYRVLTWWGSWGSQSLYSTWSM